MYILPHFGNKVNSNTLKRAQIVGNLLILSLCLGLGGEMLAVVFSVICIISIVWSLLLGNTEEAATALLAGAGRSVELTLSLVGIMGLWNGVMAVLREAGAIRWLSRLLRPIMRFIFKKPCDEAVACLSANMLGIGNAATPLGIAALKKIQGGEEKISDDSVMLTVLCCGGVSAIPTTLLALRKEGGGELLFELLPIIWIVGGIGIVSSVLFTKLFSYLFRKAGK